MISLQDVVIGFTTIKGIGIALLSILLAFLLGKKIKWIVEEWVSKSVKDETIISLLGNASKYLVYVVGVGIALDALGLGGVASALITSAGLSAVVVGFALQDIGKNFISGLLLAFDKPFKVGDVIETSGQKGIVKEITLRNTKILTFDKREVYIPSMKIFTNPLTNYSIEGKVKEEIELQFLNEIPVEEAKKMVEEEIKKLAKVKEVAKDPKPFSFVAGFDRFVTKIKVWFWVEGKYDIERVQKIKDAFIAGVKKRAEKRLSKGA